MNKKGHEGEWIVYVIILLVFSPFVYLHYFGFHGELKFCEEREYNYFETKHIEQGYVQCCNDVYVNHTLIDERDCEIFKLEEIKDEI